MTISDGETGYRLSRTCRNSSGAGDISENEKCNFAFLIQCVPEMTYWKLEIVC